MRSVLPRFISIPFAITNCQDQKVILKISFYTPNANQLSNQTIIIEVRDDKNLQNFDSTDRYN